eukprot:GHVL01010468.1.p1 GENE.GHVL01010468.1~~GHVL01010468.1.p1  ORF type:complete len:667 (+),score=73.16 GHVL01010468.1:68-2068(+)
MMHIPSRRGYCSNFNQQPTFCCASSFDAVAVVSNISDETTTTECGKTLQNTPFNPELSRATNDFDRQRTSSDCISSLELLSTKPTQCMKFIEGTVDHQKLINILASDTGSKIFDDSCAEKSQFCSSQVITDKKPTMNSSHISNTETSSWFNNVQQSMGSECQPRHCLNDVFLSHETSDTPSSIYASMYDQGCIASTSVGQNASGVASDDLESGCERWLGTRLAPSSESSNSVIPKEFQESVNQIFKYPVTCTSGPAHEFLIPHFDIPPMTQAFGTNKEIQSTKPMRVSTLNGHCLRDDMDNNEPVKNHGSKHSGGCHNSEVFKMSPIPLGIADVQCNGSSSSNGECESYSCTSLERVIQHQEKDGDTVDRIPLGEQGRAKLKSRISDVIRADPDLRVRISTIGKVKSASIPQLLKMAKMCGVWEFAVDISQNYLKNRLSTRTPKSCSVQPPAFYGNSCNRQNKKRCREDPQLLLNASIMPQINVSPCVFSLSQNLEMCPLVANSVDMQMMVQGSSKRNTSNSYQQIHPESYQHFHNLYRNQNLSTFGNGKACVNPSMNASQEVVDFERRCTDWGPRYETARHIQSSWDWNSSKAVSRLKDQSNNYVVEYSMPHERAAHMEYPKLQTTSSSSCHSARDIVQRLQALRPVMHNMSVSNPEACCFDQSV